jgi:Spy/CpxP family protein refolding chaperone
MTILSKSRTYQLLLAICVLCLSFALATQSFAAERGKWGDRDKKFCDRHYGRHHQVWPLLMRLDLNATQEKEIREIRNSMLKNMIQKKADLKIARLELHELLHKEPVDMAAVESQVKKMESLRTSMILDGIKTRQEIKSKLTPGQRKKLKELIRSSWQGQHKPGVHKRERF